MYIIYTFTHSPRRDQGKYCSYFSNIASTLISIHAYVYISDPMDHIVRKQNAEINNTFECVNVFIVSYVNGVISFVLIISAGCRSRHPSKLATTMN